MVKAVFDELARDTPRRRFTVGIVDDVTRRSLPLDDAFDIEPDDVARAVFYGLGSDGTVSSNKTTIKIIGEETPAFAQGYFVYDSQEVGRHHGLAPALRTAADPLLLQDQARALRGRARPPLPRHARRARARRARRDRAAQHARACRGAVGHAAARGAAPRAREAPARSTSSTGAPWPRRRGSVATSARSCRPASSRSRACCRARRPWCASRPASRSASGGGAPTSSQPTSRPSARRWRTSCACPRRATLSATRGRPAPVPPEAPPFVQRVTAAMLAGHGDLLPVSAFPVDGTWPIGTAQYEKRGLAQEIPIWDPALCIQCNKCSFVCPHAAIRTKVFDPAHGAGAPPGQKPVAYKAGDFPGHAYTVQVAPDDCTGCGLCVAVCPAKDRTVPRHKAIDMLAGRRASRARARRLRLLSGCPTPIARASSSDVKGSPVARAALRVLGRLRGLRRDALREAAHAALRRPGADRERHGLLVDLRRQPARRRPTARTPRGAGRRGPTRSSRTTPSSAWASGSRSTRTRPQARAPAGRARARGCGDGARERRCSRRRRRRRGGPRRAARARGGPARAPRGAHGRGRARASTLARRRTSCSRVGVDRRRRRLGLRHRLRRPRPRAGVAPRRQRAGARHGGLQQHGRPGSRRRRRSAPSAKFAAGGKAVGKKDLGPARHVLRARLRGARRLRRARRADRARLPRGRGLPGPVADHRLQPLHRARLRPARTAPSSSAWPSPRGSGRSTATTRAARRTGGSPLELDSPAPTREGARVHEERGALPRGRAVRPEALRRASSSRPSASRARAARACTSTSPPMQRRPAPRRRRPAPPPPPPVAPDTSAR